jgi:3-methylfumaryl-CoA hydratase
MTTSRDELKQWIGKTETQVDEACPKPLRALAATLDRDDPEPLPGTAIPPCWHWLYFLSLPRQSEFGPDGHARRGGFLPPVPLPRRMWAGGRLEWLGPLRVGEAITKASRIVDVSSKEGRAGPLVFVRVHHEICSNGNFAIIEEQDLVYCDLAKPGELAPSSAAPASPDWSREIQPDPALLFRYSALTFNAHRIHYDRPYAMNVEGYPGLVVHGPLIATLLLDLLRRNLPDVQVRQFSFRVMKPTFDLAAFKVCGTRTKEGTSAQLWAEHPDGALAMDATASWDDANRGIYAQSS